LSFHVHLPDSEQAYLNNLPLSELARERVQQFISQRIADVSEEFRLNAENRHPAPAPYFQMRFILLDRWGDGRIHSIDFHIRDDHAAMGVLLVVFIDHRTSQ
jgi:hypothetical protein